MENQIARLSLNNTPATEPPSESHQDIENELREKLVRAESIGVRRAWVFDYKICIKDVSFSQDFSKEDTEIAELVAQVFFTGNTFRFYNISVFDNWVRLNISLVGHLRMLEINSYGSKNYGIESLASSLRKCTGVEGIVFGVDETDFVADASRVNQGYPTIHLPVGRIDSQLNLVILRHGGLKGLRKLRFQHVSFTAPFAEPNAREVKFTSGTIPGGILERVVALEMTKKRRRRINRGTGNLPFRLLDLPPEVRNTIYHFVLQVDGKINPWKRKPSSEQFSRKISKKKHRNHSVLALLETNKQIYEEALGIYYNKNHFVFYNPSQLAAFLLSTSDKRKDYVVDITLWYDKDPKGGVSMAESAVRGLRSLKQLKTLGLVIRTSRLPNEGPCWGEQELRELILSRALTVEVMDVELEHDVLSSHPNLPEDHASRVDTMRDFEKRIHGEPTEAVA